MMNRFQAMRRRLVSGESLRANIAAGAVPRGVSITIQLLLAPFIVSKIGLTAFGYWSLLLGVVQYLQIADGGLPVAALRAVAGARARRDSEQAESAVLVTLAVLSAMGAVVTAAG